MNQNDLLMLFRLIAAHMAAEWIFQFDFWKKIKSSKKLFSKQRLLQGAAVALLSYLLAGFWSAYWLPPIIFCARVAISCYNYKGKKPVLFIVLRQVLYLLVIVTCWIGMGSASPKDIIAALTPLITDAQPWILLLAYMVVICPVGILIGKITDPWRRELDKTRIKGLEKAGLWMGRLERMLILTFVLVDHYEAIGFLIAAKSILRFSEIKSSNDRKEAEYILIGTMLSFAFGVAVGIGSAWLSKKF